METQVIIWIVVGVLLILSEIVIPGAILAFIGGSAVLTGILIQLGHIEGPIQIMMTFFVSSIVFVLVLRSLFLKFMPGYSTVANTDELQDSMGDMVEVTEAITPYKRGRVKYRDCGWEAQSDFEFQVGDHAVICDRIGQCWIIKPIE